MRSVPRLGLLLATFALPLGAVLASHVLGERPVPKAPADVRVGDSHAGSVGRPSTPPSPAAVRPLVVGEPATPTSPTPPPELLTDPATSGSTAAPAAPPAAPGAEPGEDSGGPATGDPNKGKAKGRGTVPPHPTPSHGATPEGNGSEE